MQSILKSYCRKNMCVYYGVFHKLRSIFPAALKNSIPFLNSIKLRKFSTSPKSHSTLVRTWLMALLNCFFLIDYILESSLKMDFDRVGRLVNTVSFHLSKQITVIS